MCFLEFFKSLSAVYWWREEDPFNFDDFHFCRSRVIGLHMTENRIFTLCRMITWIVFLRMFWNFISSLQVKRGGSLFFLDDFHVCRSRVIGLDMTENRIFTLCRMITWIVFLRMFWNFISSLPVKRGGSFHFWRFSLLPFQSWWTWYDGK